MIDDQIGTAESRYAQLETDREVFLERARECSKFTLPMLITDKDAGDHTRFPTPYQGVGARGTNNLASKLLLALMPVNQAFFRLRIDDFALEKIEGQKNVKTDIEKALSKIERAIQTDIEMSSDRVQIFECLKHLIVGGNCLLFVGKDGIRVFHLSRYVCKRDPEGNVLEIITKESITPNVLPTALQETVQGRMEGEEKTCDLFTHVKRVKNKFKVYQEVKGLILEDTQGDYPVDKTPYLPLRMISIDGQNYGRSMVEEYLGDLQSLEYLTKAVVEGASASSKVLFMVSPNGTTRASKLADSPNGAIIEGSAQDVSVLQTNKFADFRTAYDMIGKIEQRMQMAFLLNSSVQRDAERVSATEIRFMAEDLEKALGGVYSVLSQEFQMPYIMRKIAMMTKANKLPKLPSGTVKPTIVTGLEALGRGNDREKLVMFLQTLSQTLGPEAIGKYVNLSDAITRLATADGIDIKGLIKTEEDFQAEQEAQLQAQQQQMAQEGLMNAGQKVAGNIPPEALGQAMEQYQT
jgi:hypothetical protein